MTDNYMTTNVTPFHQIPDIITNRISKNGGVGSICPQSLILYTTLHVRTKTIMRYLTPVRMATINKSTKSKFWRGYGEKRTLVHCW